MVPKKASRGSGGASPSRQRPVFWGDFVEIGKSISINFPKRALKRRLPQLSYPTTLTSPGLIIIKRRNCNVSLSSCTYRNKENRSAAFLDLSLFLSTTVPRTVRFGRVQGCLFMLMAYSVCLSHHVEKALALFR